MEEALRKKMEKRANKKKTTDTDSAAKNKPGDAGGEAAASEAAASSGGSSDQTNAAPDQSAVAAAVETPPAVEEAAVPAAPGEEAPEQAGLGEIRQSAPAAEASTPSPPEITPAAEVAPADGSASAGQTEPPQIAPVAPPQKDSAEDGNLAGADSPEAAAPEPAPAPKKKQHVPHTPLKAKPEMADDLQAKLAARRARSEVAPEPAQRASDGGGEPKNRNAALDGDLEAKLAARRARAEAPAPATLPNAPAAPAAPATPVASLQTPGADAKNQGGAAGAKNGRDSLLNFLQANGEISEPVQRIASLRPAAPPAPAPPAPAPAPAAASWRPAPHAAASPAGTAPQWREAAAAAAVGAGEDDSSDMLLGMLPGHGAAFLGHGGTPGGGGGWGFEDSAVGGFAGGGAADYHGGLVGVAGGGAFGGLDGAGEITVDELLRDSSMWMATPHDPFAAHPQLELEQALLDALDEAPPAALDPAKEVPVQWGKAAHDARFIAMAPPALPPPPPPAATFHAPPIFEPPPRAPARVSAALQPGEEPCGVGMALRVATRTMYGSFTSKKRYVLEVDSVLPGGSAHASGRIKPGDVLLAVRDDFERVGVAVGNRLEDAKTAIRGAPGSVVVLKLTRGETLRKHHQEKESFDVALVRIPGALPPEAQLGSQAGAASPALEDLDAVPEQRCVEPGDKVMLVEGMALDGIEQHDLEALFQGEDGAVAEVIVQKPDGRLFAVPFHKHPELRSFEDIWQLLHPPEPPARPQAARAPASAPPTQHALNLRGAGAPMQEARFLGSRTLARVAGAGTGIGALQEKMQDGVSKGLDGVSDLTSGYTQAPGALMAKVNDKVSGFGARLGGLFGRFAPPGSGGMPAEGQGGVWPPASDKEKENTPVREAPHTLGPLLPASADAGGGYVLVAGDAKGAVPDETPAPGGVGSPGKDGEEKSGDVAQQAVAEPRAWIESAPAQALQAELATMQLENLLETLHYNLGIECCQDLRFIEDAMLTDLHLPPVHQRKLLQLAALQKAAAEKDASPPSRGGPEEVAVAGTEQAAKKSPVVSEQAQQAQRILLEREQRKREQKKLEREQEVQKQAEQIQRMRHQQAERALEEERGQQRQEQDRRARDKENQQQAAASATRAAKGVGQCSVLHDYEAKAAHEVSLVAGDVVTLIRKHPSGWWEGIAPSGSKGWFPSTFVEDVGDAPPPPAKPASPAKPKAAAATVVAPVHASPASHHGNTAVSPTAASRAGAVPIAEASGGDGGGAVNSPAAAVEQVAEAGSGGAGWEGAVAPEPVSRGASLTLTLDCSPSTASATAALAQGGAGDAAAEESARERLWGEGAGLDAGTAQAAVMGSALSGDVPVEGGDAQSVGQQAGGVGHEVREEAASGPGDDAVGQAETVAGVEESAAQDLPGGAGESAELGESAGTGEVGGEDVVDMEGGEGPVGADVEILAEEEGIGGVVVGSAGGEGAGDGEGSESAPLDE